MGGRGDDRRLDGFWIGRHNFLLYDHPTRGWLWIPHDLDATIDWVSGRRSALLLGPLHGVGRTLAALRGRDQRSRPGSERYVAALRHAYEVFRRGEAPRSARSLRGPGGRRRSPRIRPGRSPSTTTWRGGVAARRVARARRLDRRLARLPRGAGRGTTPTATATPFCFDCNDSDAAASSGRARDLRRRPRSELRRQRLRRLLVGPLADRWCSPDVTP